MNPSVLDDRQITVYSCTSADKQIDQKRFKKIFVTPQLCHQYNWIAESYFSRKEFVDTK